MAKLSRNFIAGRMNKMTDERLVPNGEYIDAMNVRMGSTELSEIGVIENTKGNESLTTLRYIDGTPLSTSAKCIGAYADGANETIYWFINDPNFTVGATQKLDMIVSFNVNTDILTYHVISIDNGNGIDTTLNFEQSHLITAINKIENLLFFSDNYNPPRFINVKTNYPNPVSNVDDPLLEETLLVIKKPPVHSPAIQPITTLSQDNYITERFICFAYRYRYADNQYSATSQFSQPAFVPKPFDFSGNSYLNEGMVNQYNAVIVTYNSGGPLVVGIDLLFKQASSNIIKVIEKLDKNDLGLLDNTDYQYVFDNSKIFTVLPDYEILRLYDNVPLLAKAQTIMGNRLMYGNYLEGYDLLDKYGNPVKFEYETLLQTNLIGYTDVSFSFDDVFYYDIDPDNTSYNPPNHLGIIVGLAGQDLSAGSQLTIEFNFEHNTFTGISGTPTSQTSSQTLVFTFPLNTSYNSVYEMWSSTEFQNALGTALNIKPIYDPTPGAPTSCDGTTFMDAFNCIIPDTLTGSGGVTWHKYQSGYFTTGEGFNSVSIPGSADINFYIPAMQFVDDLTTPTQYAYEYYKITSAEVRFTSVGNIKSLHSNRGYEVGIVYMDEFLRSSTALVSPTNVIHVPCSASDTQNLIQVQIPTTQIAPYWAKYYKFVIKATQEKYETIYSGLFFKYVGVYTYFLLEGENSYKVEVGDRLIVKVDSNGPLDTCTYATVLEKSAQQEGFITVTDPNNPSINLYVPAGVYMKMNTSNFQTVYDPLASINFGGQSICEEDSGEYPELVYKACLPDGTNVDVPAGSKISLYIKWSRQGTGDGNNGCERRIYTLEKTYYSSADYVDLRAWFDGDNIQNTINSGVQEVGGSGNCNVVNVYLPGINTGVLPKGVCENFMQFGYLSGSGGLYLAITGTKRCTGVGDNEKRMSCIQASIKIVRAGAEFVFETQPSDTLPDVFFENDLSFEINQATGEHMGNVQDQDFNTGAPAIIDTNFFNCYAFGNGVESYKVRDSIIGRDFNLGNRVTIVSTQDYQEIRKFADITYSGIYNNESNVNKLNEFNLGLLNFKPLTQSFGPIYLMDARRTDILVLQEDKISYVLSDKNLLSDSGVEGGTIVATPEVLGTQIARTEEYGISFNPESYIQWGYDRFFTDVKRGAVIQLKGGEDSQDQLRVISESGMRTWFRDEFRATFQYQKLGAFDPYMNEYVLAVTENPLPDVISCLQCGVTQEFFVPIDKSINYCVNLGNLIGPATITVQCSQGFGTLESIYNGTSQSLTFSPSSTPFTLTIDKNSNTVSYVQISIGSISAAQVLVTVNCPTPQELSIVRVVLTNDVDSGDTIHIQHRWTDGTFISPNQSIFTTFATGATNPLVSYYNMITGPQGSGAIPIDGATMKIATSKYAGDTFNFNAYKNDFLYLRTNTFYDNTPGDISSLLAAATVGTPIVNPSAGNYYADVPTGTSGGYLYLIWDLRQSYCSELCYSTTGTLQDICCPCEPCASSCSTFEISDLDNGSNAYIIIERINCSTGAPEQYVLSLSGSVSYTICSETCSPPTFIQGTGTVTRTLCGCESDSLVDLTPICTTSDCVDIVLNSNDVVFDGTNDFSISTRRCSDGGIAYWTIPYTTEPNILLIANCSDLSYNYPLGFQIESTGILTQWKAQCPVLKCLNNDTGCLTFTFYHGSMTFDGNGEFKVQIFSCTTQQEETYTAFEENPLPLVVVCADKTYNHGLGYKILSGGYNGDINSTWDNCN